MPSSAAAKEVCEKIARVTISLTALMITLSQDEKSYLT